MTPKKNFPFALALILLTTLAGCGKETVETTTTTVAPASPAPAAVPTPPLTPAETPEALIADLYEQHTHDRGPFFQTEHRDRVERFFVKDLGDLLWKDATDSKGEVGALDFDPLYNAQDTDIKNFKIEPAVIEASKASVRVTFDNFDTKTVIIYSLALENGNWRISDMQWDGERTLRQALQPDSAAAPL